MIFIYPFLVILSISITCMAYLFAPVLALFVDENGDLPKFLRWFQTPDNPCWGDVMFTENQGAGFTQYERTVLWLWRNPAQGFDTCVKAACSPNETGFILGNPFIHDGAQGIDGSVFVMNRSYFWFELIIPLGFGRCLISHFGWRLLDQSQNFGQFTFTPFRINHFD